MGVTDATKTPPEKQSCVGFRHLIVFLLFLGTTVSYASRVSLSLAIVAMTTNNTHDHPTFEWDRSVQDTMLSSFFWGYVVLQVPAGMLTGRWGGYLPVTVSMLANALLNFLLPLAAIKGGWQGACACRVGMGLTQGLMYPSLHGLLGQWVPLQQRSRFATFVYAGSQLGTIVEMVVAGVVAESSWGWPGVFYVAGAMSGCWALLWMLFGASSPAGSRWCPDSEKRFIQENAGAGSHQLGDDKVTAAGVPWRAVWTSLPFWSILLAHSAQSLGFWTLLTETPSYIHHVFGVNLKENGQLSALPYAAMWITSFIFSFSADMLINRRLVSPSTGRKIFNTIAFWGPAASLLALAYLPVGEKGQAGGAVALLSLTAALNGAHFVGFLINHMDLAPRWASTLMGVTNGFGNLFSIAAPLTVTLLVKDESSPEEWRKVFFISIALYFLGNLFYLLFMSAELQPWNTPTPKNTNDIEIQVNASNKELEKPSEKKQVQAAS